MSVKTVRRSLAALLVAAASIGAIAQVQAADVLRIGYQKYGSLVLLKARGSLEQRLAQQGFEVRWTEFPGGPQLLEGLNVGSVDFGLTGETPPVFAQAARAELRYVAFDAPAPAGEAILVPQDSPIRSVAELKGKKVALNKGSNVHYLLVRALEEAGLSIRDITPVYLPPADGRAAFESRRVDAWVIWDPFQAAAEEQLQARTLRDGSGLVDNHQFYLASQSFAERHPEVIALLVEELKQVGAEVERDPHQAAQIIAPLIGLPADIAAKALGRQAFQTRFITPEVVEAQQRIADTFSDLKLIPKRLTIQDVVWTPPAAAVAQSR